MSINRFVPHLVVIPEDRADEQIANGFAIHYQVDARRIEIVSPAGGWSYVLKLFEDKFERYLRDYPAGYIVLLIDFDGNYEVRRRAFAEKIPEDLRARVFVLGSAQTPQLLKDELDLTLEVIGTSLAEDCRDGTVKWWSRNGLAHNEPDRQRLLERVRPFLFGT